MVSPHPSEVVTDCIGTAESPGSISVYLKQATKTGDTRQREILPSAKKISRAEAVEDIQTLASQGKIDAVRSEPQVIYNALTCHGCQVERGILSALQGASASHTRKEICVGEVGVLKPVERIADHECLVGREVVIHPSGHVVPSSVCLAGKIEQTADVVHFGPVRS